MSDSITYWVLPLHLRPHQVTKRHQPVVLRPDYGALLVERDALLRTQRRFGTMMHEQMEKYDALRKAAGLARGWMEDADHHADCNAAAWDEDGPYTRHGAPCTCGRDALFATLEMLNRVDDCDAIGIKYGEVSVEAAAEAETIYDEIDAVLAALERQP